MRIAIVGQTKNNLKQTVNYLEKFSDLNSLQINHVCFESEKEFLKKLSNDPLDVVLLFDTKNKKSIIDLSYEIRDIAPKIRLILISDSKDFAVDSYKVDASYYLLNPFSFDEFENAMKRCLRESIKNYQYIVVSSNWQKIPVFLKDIQFAEKSGHNVIIHTKDKIISTRMTFEKFFKKIQSFDDFINCVRGELVNLNWVDHLESQNFVMKSGDKIPIRRQDRKKIKKIYYEYQLSSRTENL